MTTPFLAIDWGTTNRRIFVIADRAVTLTERDDQGVMAVQDFEVSIAEIRRRFGDLPMLLAGMVGSTVGWRGAPYVSTPAGISDLAAHMLWVDDRTAIVPGVSMLGDGRVDVMRGEEVQFLGAEAAGLVPSNAILVQPGTHCKWAELRGGRIVNFTTAITGELFALLKRHGLLAPQLAGKVTATAAFLDGVREGRRRDIAASLFGIRAASLLGTRADADSAAFASGLLIGSDVAARLSEVEQKKIYILAGSELGTLYSTAISAYEREAVVVDSHAAFAAGIIAIEELS